MMDAEEKLERYFDIALEASDGVDKVRELILSLAMQGKLVPQDLEDEPASVLLEEIAAERERLVAEGAIRKSKKLKTVGEDEVPFRIPETWVWERLGRVTAIVRGITFPASEKTKSPHQERIACLRTTNVQSKIEWDDLLFIDRKFLRNDAQLLMPDDIVMSMANSRALVGKVAIASEIPTTEATFGGFLGVIRTIKSVPSLLMRFLRSPYAREALIGAASQTTNIANISATKLNQLAIPVPPLSEQNRIVAKIDRLMSRCDELDKLKAERAEQRIIVNSAALKRLTTAPDTTTFRKTRDFIGEHFHELYSVEENIEELRKAILQLAVMGKLVPQDPNDPPASELLEEIHYLPTGYERRRKLIKNSPVDVSHGILGAVPKSWVYVSIQDLYDLKIIIDYADGNHGSLYPRKSEFDNDGVAFVTAKDIVGGTVRWETCSRLNRARANQLTKGWAQSGDVLLTHNATVGRVAKVSDAAERFLLGTSVTFYRLNERALSPDFFYIVLRSPIWQRQLEAIMAQTTRNQVSIQKQAFFKIPLPPVAEQLRIVEEVRTLLACCTHFDSCKASHSAAHLRVTSGVALVA